MQNIVITVTKNELEIYLFSQKKKNKQIIE